MYDYKWKVNGKPNPLKQCRYPPRDFPVGGCH